MINTATAAVNDVPTDAGSNAIIQIAKVVMASDSTTGTNTAEMRSASDRVPQDGALTMQVDGREVQFRVGSLPTVHGEKIVLRVLDFSDVPTDFGQLGIEGRERTLLERAMRAGGNSRVQARFFPGVNHHFQRDPVGAREGYDKLPTQDLAPEVLDTLCSWLGITLLR